MVSDESGPLLGGDWHPLVDARAADSIGKWRRGATDDSVLPTPRGYRTVTLGDLRRHLADPQPPPTPPPGTISVVLPVLGALKPGVEWVRRNRVIHGDLGLELMLCVSGDHARHRLAGTAAWALDGGRLLALPPGTAWNAAAAAGLAHAGGDVTVLVRPQVGPPDWPWLAELAEAARHEQVGLAQPVLLAPDFTVAAAGAAGGRPLLAGWTQGDAARLSAVPGVWPGAVAGRTDLLRSMAATDERVLARRLQEGGRATVVVATSRVRLRRPIEAEAVAPIAPIAPTGPATGPAIGPAIGPAESVWASAGLTPTGGRIRDGRLRWVVDIAAPSGRYGERWGDFHFATSLCAALERQGHLATVDTPETRNRATGDAEDVVVVLRGLERVAPRPRATNLLWVISHPELVTAGEVAEFDLAFAASIGWSAERNAAWGTRIEPLLQCTDATRFNPSVAAAGSGHRVLFVGNSRRQQRPVVQLAQHSGLAVYGSAWQGLIDPALVVAPSVPNEELGRLYGAAGVVLNDHWPDMRAAGFVSNRLFDAVACGARVISDPIAGADRLFRGAVQTFTTPSEFHDLLDGDWAAHFPDDATRQAIAQDVVANHSFDARARRLGDAVRLLRMP